MAIVPSGFRFIGIAPSVDLTERRSKIINEQTEPFTIEDIANTVGVGAQGPQGVQGPAGPLGPVGPAGLEWQGAWVSETSYVADDAVGYDGASWFCILATSGTTTPDLDATHWALLASQGAQGIQGVQGPTGAQGAGASQTLQQTVDLGNRVTSGTNRLTLSASSVSLIDTNTGLGNVLYRDALRFNRDNGSGTTRYINLLSPSIISDIRNITLPDASGAVTLNAQLPTVAGNYANDTAAAIGGILVGNMYHTAGVVKIRLA